MKCSPVLQVCCFLVVLCLPTRASAQEKKYVDGWLSADAATEFIGGSADQWLQALVDSQEMADSNLYSDRLSFFYLTPDQVLRLQTAADKEESDEKRLLLWQAIRQSREKNSRDYLMRKVVQESNAEVQVQFLDGLRNPSRFDIPLIVALYNSHRSQQKKVDVAQAPDAGANNSKTRQSSRTRASRTRVGATSAAKAAEANTDEKSVVVQDADNDLAEEELWLAYRDHFDVQRKIVDLVCYTDWSELTVMTGWTYPGERYDQATNAKWLEISGFREEQADRAHEEMIHWLIKNGSESNHRVNAFQSYIAPGRFVQRHKTNNDLVKALLRKLDDPPSRARAVGLVKNWQDPSQFLGDEEEIVRLSAIEAMQDRVMESYGSLVYNAFLDRIAFYRPLLNNIRSTDPSDKVKVAAQQLLRVIDSAEKEYLKDPQGPK